MKKAATLFALLFSISLLSQTSYKIQFEDEVVVIKENISSFQWSQMPESSKFENGYYGWVQFFSTPTQSLQNELKTRGLELIEYLPNKAYVFYFPETTSVQYLKDIGVRAIVPIKGQYKLSSALKMPPYPAYALNGDNILVTLEFQKHTNATYVIEELARQQITVQQQYRDHNIMDLSIPNNCLETLSNLPFVKWIELIIAPDIKDDTRGRSLHRSSNLDTQTTAGRNYTGAGIGVMVRDDGIVGPHIDYQGRIDNSGATGTGQTHGDGVGGIMAGAGNLDPMMRGMAAGSDVYVVNYVGNFLDTQTTSLINDGSVQITNSSYSNGCNAGYTTITSTVDEQTKDIPSLLHVFSAGNSNNIDCGYGAGNQWGNITGGHKQGKNVIATANVFFDGSLVNSSSRGPAHDGRIKPDIAANGQNQNSTDENNEYLVFGGTSGAAPGIAGISAQLYEAYGDLNGGALPQSALIKAALLNTANDAGNVGPDYRFGWGIVNGLRAAKTIEDGSYLSDIITQGATNNHTINVPAGTAQVRFMVYWSDTQASAGANPALVNDLDLVVTDPASNTLLPWILDPTPDPVALNTPATFGADHLNNVEQVLINAPAAGDYTLDISGFNVPVGPQEYFVVYTVISDNVTVTYPDGGESFVAGETESIHWDAINTTEDFDLEYSTDGGGTWTMITTVPFDTTNFGWDVPTTITGGAQIRVSNASFSDTSDANFSVTNQVEGFAFSVVCPSEATFTWDAVAGAESYDVYLLGTKYMEVAGNTATTTITLPIGDPIEVLWAAIVAKNDTENWVSRRTIAISNEGILNCVLPNDVGTIALGNSIGDFSAVCSGDTEVIISAQINNPGINAQSNFDVSYQLSGQAAITETFTGTLNSGEDTLFTFATPLTIDTNGAYILTVTTALVGDENIYNNTFTLDFFATIEATELEFEEDFETNGVPPEGWLILNADDDFTWIEAAGILGSDGAPTTIAGVDNYNYNAPGEEDILVTEIFDLSTVDVAMLSFDLAKAQFSNAFFDGLRVEVSIDCGGTYTTIYDKTNLELSTIPNYNTDDTWIPSSAADWRNEQIDLTSYLGEVVQLRFVNVNGFGNTTLIDNVNLSSILGLDDSVISGINVFPNPATDTFFIQLTNEAIIDASITIVNNLGQTVQTITNEQLDSNNTVEINISGYTTGMYFVTIEALGTAETKKLMVE